MQASLKVCRHWKSLGTSCTLESIPCIYPLWDQLNDKTALVSFLLLFLFFYYTWLPSISVVGLRKDAYLMISLLTFFFFFSPWFCVCPYASLTSHCSELCLLWCVLSSCATSGTELLQAAASWSLLSWCRLPCLYLKLTPPAPSYRSPVSSHSPFPNAFISSPSQSQFPPRKPNHSSSHHHLVMH